MHRASKVSVRVTSIKGFRSRHEMEGQRPPRTDRPYQPFFTPRSTIQTNDAQPNGSNLPSPLALYSPPIYR
jgi:hypothetical protein